MGHLTLKHKIYKLQVRIVDIAVRDSLYPRAPSLATQFTLYPRAPSLATQFTLKGTKLTKEQHVKEALIYLMTHGRVRCTH